MTPVCPTVPADGRKRPQRHQRAALRAALSRPNEDPAQARSRLPLGPDAPLAGDQRLADGARLLRASAAGTRAAGCQSLGDLIGCRSLVKVLAGVGELAHGATWSNGKARRTPSDLPAEANAKWRPPARRLVTAMEGPGGRCQTSRGLRERSEGGPDAKWRHVVHDRLMDDSADPLELTVMRVVGADAIHGSARLPRGERQSFWAGWSWPRSSGTVAGWTGRAGTTAGAW